MGTTDIAPETVIVVVSFSLLGGYSMLSIFRSNQKHGRNRRLKDRWTEEAMEGKAEMISSIQTLRNSIMSVSLLASAMLTVGVWLVKLLMNPEGCSNMDAQAARSPLTALDSNGNPVFSTSDKVYAAIVITFLAFFFLTQSMRHVVNTGFYIRAVCVYSGSDESKLVHDDYHEHITEVLHHGSLFFLLGLRATYFWLPVFFWLFGPIYLLVISTLLTCMLYYSDTTHLITPLVKKRIKQETEGSDETQEQAPQV